MVGTTISHYKILEKLGEGGMGVVYKARDTKLIRTVALKFLSSQAIVDGEGKARFLREAQSASALNHPNICTIYEIDEAGGEMFIVMEYVDGRNLRSMIEAGPLPVPEALTIAYNVAEGLHAAHQKGMVHRDVKPENIIITGGGIAKIADFGLARTIMSPAEVGEKLVVGTIGYMAPEQLRGEQVSHLADIWALGIVLYEMLTGRRPFRGEYEEAMMYAIANEKIPPVSSIRPGISESVERIIDRCLEKSPAVRIQDAGVFIEELGKAREEVNRLSTTTAKSIAVLPFADISPGQDNQYFSDGLTEEIIANLSRLQMVRVISRTSVMQYERAGKSMKQIAAELGVQFVLEGSVRKNGTDLRITTQLIDAVQDTYLWVEKYDGTMDEIFEIQEHVAGRIAKALKMKLTTAEKRNLKRRPTKNTEAYQLYLKGRFFWSKRTKDALQTALRYFEEAIEKDPRFALAWAGIADVYNLLSEYGSLTRKETYSKAMAAVRKALEFDDRLAEAHASLASLIMFNDWDWTTSEKEFNRAISLNPEYATAHHWYSGWLLLNGRISEAITEISLAAELDPFSPAILKDKGMTFYYAENYDGAMECARKTLELDPGFASGHRLLSLAYQGKRMFNEAIEENRRWGELSGNQLEATIMLAHCYAVDGRRTESLELLNGALKESLSNGNLMRGVALVYAALGENDQAFTWLDKSYDSRADALSSLKIDPKFRHLRADPRFVFLLKRIGLEK